MYPCAYFHNDMPASLYFVRKIAYKWFGVYRCVLTCIWLWLSAMYLTMTICNTQIKANFSHITLHACMCPLCVEDCLYVYQRPRLWKNENIFRRLIALIYSTLPHWRSYAAITQIYLHISMYPSAYFHHRMPACATLCRGLPVRVSATLLWKNWNIFLRLIALIYSTLLDRWSYAAITQRYLNSWQISLEYSNCRFLDICSKNVSEIFLFF